MTQRGRRWAATVAAAAALGGAVVALAQQPQAGSPDLRTAPITETSTLQYQPPPPPIMLPQPNLQVPCMGWAPSGCDNPQQ